MAAESQQKSICTVEADLELLSRYQNGDHQALEALFEVHLRLIKFWVRKVWHWADREEVMQEAKIGLSNAVMEFNASKDSDFHAQARRCVMRAVFESRAVMPVKRTLYNHYRQVMKAQDILMRKLGRRPTLEELSNEAGLSVTQVENALNVIAAFPLPLEAADGKLAIEEPFQIEDPYESQLVKDALKQLSRDEAKIIILYYYYGKTDREIGEDLGKSEDAVKMARTRALAKLRDIISGEGV
ncbi:MAG TPA: sigma-70 family RNA polymerase sigma factor [Pyrinomonadaceae bacterium]|nr:sigma-70 family RNA polymerase sigma factor [Pyrinomonadaceae bacterium]